MLRKVLWFGLIVGLLLIVAGVVFAASCDYRNQGVSTPTSTPTPTPTSTPESESGLFIYNGIKLGLTERADADGDWVSDRLEFREYGTNPLEIDTDGDGIDDFNEIFTYPHLLDPLDPTDAEEFISMLPNVKAESWGERCGYPAGNTSAVEAKFVEVGKRDPLVQWYAERTTIKWQDSTKKGVLVTVNEEPLFLKGERTDCCSPSYYLTQGRRGNCLQVSIAHYTILELMGYECLLITSEWENGRYHGSVEAEIEGKIYAVDFNLVESPPETFYQNRNWTIIGKKDL